MGSTFRKKESRVLPITNLSKSKIFQKKPRLLQKSITHFREASQETLGDGPPVGKPTYGARDPDLVRLGSMATTLTLNFTLDDKITLVSSCSLLKSSINNV